MATPPHLRPGAVLLAAQAGRTVASPSIDWDGVGVLAERYRLGGLVWSVYNRLGPPPSELARFEGAHACQALVADTLMGELAAVRESLSGNGIPVWVIKGGALIEAGAYEGGERALDDVDVVIPEALAGRAIRALTDAGFRSWHPSPEETVGWADSATFAVRDPSLPFDVSIDLHWRLQYDALRYGPGNGGSTTEWMANSGHPPPEAHLVLCLEHVLKHLRYRLHAVGFGDAIRLARRVADWSSFDRWLAGSRLRRPALTLLIAILDEAGEVLDIPGSLHDQADPSLLESLRPSHLFDRRRPRMTPMGGLAHRWRLGGPSAVVADVRSAAFPPKAWLAARYGFSGGETRARMWAQHAGRLLGWGTGLGKSPLSPNQD